jgi:hypothetical protein
MSGRLSPDGILFDRSIPADSRMAFDSAAVLQDREARRDIRLPSSRPPLAIDVDITEHRQRELLGRLIPHLYRL